MNKSKIAILTTVANFDLYKITSKLFPNDIKKYVIDGSNGMHGIHSLIYMFDKLSKKDIDWLILADEDVIFKNNNLIFSLIDKMEADQFTACGVRDGGVVKHRTYNPHMVNTFFTVLNFREIIKIWDKQKVLKNQYLLPLEFNIDNAELRGVFDIDSLYEPYYCFFLWLKRKGKSFLYLESKMLDDNISNVILFSNQEVAYHTWYARSYNKNEKHTNRINGVFNTLGIDFNIDTNDLDLNITIFKDRFFYTRMKILKIITKIQRKINLNKV
ncbi:hypothetical protein F6U93_11445 [Tamlana haliotis]|uniref:Nucleotide-diphospho-sugar transferase domain-containing protein n=1 Tax=Pseudotamlana haliotis TaxID=2614804 RepID=A0A6N6M960_9FLAO|nr:hypothetical protein [Tamlana haliotis]KAB1067029.1 hypothetical protein F6U93_11445 [Tamlana haliotis]